MISNMVIRTNVTDSKTWGGRGVEDVVYTRDRPALKVIGMVNVLREEDVGEGCFESEGRNPRPYVTASAGFFHYSIEIAYQYTELVALTSFSDPGRYNVL